MPESLWPDGYWKDQAKPDILLSTVTELPLGETWDEISKPIFVNDSVAGLTYDFRQNKWWGFELTYRNTDKYCAKLLHFNEHGHTSMHFHVNKTETLIVVHGVLTLEYIDNKVLSVVRLAPFSAWHIPPGHPHRLIAAEGPLTLIEASTFDTPEDSIRIA